jgi:hypothetical protein
LARRLVDTRELFVREAKLHHCGAFFGLVCFRRARDRYVNGWAWGGVVPASALMITLVKYQIPTMVGTFVSGVKDHGKWPALFGRFVTQALP